MAEGVGVEAERRGEKIHRVTSPNWRALDFGTKEAQAPHLSEWRWKSKIVQDKALLNKQASAGQMSLGADFPKCV
jgi:hypothetical protein